MSFCCRCNPMFDLHVLAPDFSKQNYENYFIPSKFTIYKTCYKHEIYNQPVTAEESYKIFRENCPMSASDRMSVWEKM